MLRNKTVVCSLQGASPSPGISQTAIDRLFQQLIGQCLTHSADRRTAAAAISQAQQAVRQGQADLTILRGSRQCHFSELAAHQTELRHVEGQVQQAEQSLQILQTNKCDMKARLNHSLGQERAKLAALQVMPPYDQVFAWPSFTYF